MIHIQEATFIDGAGVSLTYSQEVVGLFALPQPLHVIVKDVDVSCICAEARRPVNPPEVDGWPVDRAEVHLLLVRPDGTLSGERGILFIAHEDVRFECVATWPRRQQADRLAAWQALAAVLPDIRLLEDVTSFMDANRVFVRLPRLHDLVAPLPRPA